MKKLEPKVTEYSNKYGINVLTLQSYLIRNVSKRRAKIIASRHGLFMKGSQKKNNLKWTNYNTTAGWSKRTRKMFINFSRTRFVRNEE